MEYNKLYLGHAIDVLKTFPDECVDCFITSPPYWNLRAYQTSPIIWGGDENCDHEWGTKIITGQHTPQTKWKAAKAAFSPNQSSFCKKCGCYDEKTEVLTDNGWKFFSDLKKHDLVASLNNGRMEFVKPSHYFEYDYDGNLIHFHGQNLDLCVTPDHNMFVRKRSFKYKNKIKTHGFSFVAAEKTRLGYRIKRDSDWSGVENSEFVIPFVFDERNRIKNSKKIIINMEDWMRFFGLWVADGSTSFRMRKTQGPEYLVKITQTKHVAEVQSILEKLPFKFSRSRNKDFCIYNKQLWSYLSVIGKTKEKFVPKEFKVLSRKYLAAFLDGYILGDGHIRQDGRIGASTISKKLADDLQEIGTKLGYATVIGERDNSLRARQTSYRLSFLSNQLETAITNKNTIKYKGKVFCVEVPTHVLFVRRNGKACWCGNSWLGELGAEPDPDLFISHLCDVFDQVKRVLKPTGTAWINIADSYGGSGGAGGDYNEGGLREGQPKFKGNNYQPKSLVGIPERMVLEMQARGWIRRNTIFWKKGNVMPSSSKDRFTNDTEYIYFFTKSTKYYFKQQFEPYEGPINRWGGEKISGNGESLWDKNTGQSTYTRERNLRPSPEGRNMRTTWFINVGGDDFSKGKHFAVFPRKLVETPIKAGCPEGGVVLDCFAGSGTTCRVAYDLKRKYVGVELNPEFMALAEKRLAQQNLFDFM